MPVYEYTKDCGFETRTARIFVGRSNCSVYIEGSRDIYDFDAETFEDAVKIVKRYGFDKLVEVF